MKTTIGRALLVTLLATGAVVTACSKRPSAGATATDSAKRYPIHGKVVSIDAAHQQILLDHQAVPGLMDAMTMDYKVADPAALGELHPGDMISATLAVTDASARLENVVITAQAQLNVLPKVQYHVPAAGDQVPDFTLLNQSGKDIHISQFRGKVLLLTFIYTRCPLSDFCPRMSQNFATIDSQLATDPKLYANTHLLSISFDPAYDKPAVLRSYGEAYTGRYTKETFAHWDFAAAPRQEVAAITQYFDVGVQPGEKNTITHTLSTVVIGKDGKILEWYPTNDWSPADVLSVVRKAAAA